MNVIISNKYRQQLNTLEIEISKKLEGEFEVDEILSQFSNYFYNKMIIDITAIKDYENINNLKKIPMKLNVEKIIFLLDSDNVNQEFLSQLVSIGIYNFTTTIEGVMYLYSNPNSYRDVAKYQDVGIVEQPMVEEAKEEPKIEKKEVLPPTFDNRNLSIREYPMRSRYILGIKNITAGAGATTLTYMIKNELSKYMDTVAIEINKKDFIFLRDPDLISVDGIELNSVLNRLSDKDAIILDLNSYGNTTICNDIIYLIEPTTIKLNKMVMLDRKVFDKYIGKKIVLNKSLLERKDISSFELESGSQVYYNIPPLDEKKDNAEHLTPLLERLGIVNGISSDSSNDKFMGIFRY